MLLVQNNMDCQACTSKAGVIEYMTKYMTKTGSGSLINVMETSFAKCMEKALSEDKGAKSAISKFLNVVAASDVKCLKPSIWCLICLELYARGNSLD